MRKFFKYFLATLISLLIIANLWLWLSGNTHLYKGIANTYFKGKKGVAIDEYHIFANREIAAGNYQPWDIHSKFGEFEPPQDVKHMMDTLKTVSCVIIKNDSLYYEFHVDGKENERLTNSFSMAKSVVGLLAMKAIEQGKISLEDPLSKYLDWPNYQDPQDPIKVWHLLSMCSGVDFDESYTRSSPFVFSAKAYFGSDIEDILAQYGKLQKAGEGFNYQSGNTQLLSIILEKATGLDVSTLASEWLWKPLGMQHDASWSLDQEGGYEKSFCCIQSTAADWARIGAMVMNHGKWQGKQIVDSALVADMVSPSPCDWKGEKPNYGLSWWLYPDERGDIFYARGILGQYVICVPEKDIVFVRMGHLRGEKLPNGHPVDFVRYVDMIYEQL